MASRLARWVTASALRLSSGLHREAWRASTRSRDGVDKIVTFGRLARMGGNAHTSIIVDRLGHLKTFYVPIKALIIARLDTSAGTSRAKEGARNLESRDFYTPVLRGKERLRRGLLFIQRDQ